MNKTMALVGACALLLSGAASAETLRFATEGAYPPFNYVDANNQLHGFDVDITHALCEQMKVECTLVAQDWEGIIPALMARKYDAVVASMINTEERRKKIAFTDHYYRTPLTVARLRTARSATPRPTSTATPLAPSRRPPRPSTPKTSTPRPVPT